MFKICILALAIALFSATAIYAAEDFPQPISDIVSVEITHTTEFIFTPDVTGYWVFRTSDNRDYDPRLWLRNMYGLLIAEDDDSGGDLNALMTVHLVGGVDYLLETGFWRGNTGVYTLSVYLVDRFVRPPNPWDNWDWDDWHWDDDWLDRWVPITIPEEGGSFISTEFTQSVYFTPNATGFWAFDISGFGNIRIHDPLENELLWITSFEAGTDTIFTIHLVEGVPYHIDIRADWDSEYALITATIFYSETAYPWISLEEFEEYYGMNIGSEFVQLQAGQQDLQGDGLFSFVPQESGFWHFEITGFAARFWQPNLTLSDRYLSFFADCWAQQYSSGAMAYLAEGFEYILMVSDSNPSNAWQLYDGAFTLSITLHDFEILRETDATAQTQTIPLPPPLLPTLDLPAVLPRAYAVIPPTGGQMEILAGSLLSFTPAVTSTWVIEAGSDATHFTVRDGSGSFAISNRRGATTINLAAGVEYFIEVDIWGLECVLFVSPYYQIHHFVPGMEIERIVLRETDFSFIPNMSGIWIMETISFRGVDPYLWLLDANGNIITQDDDSGSGLDALIKIELTAGEEYTVRAGFFDGSAGRYTLRINMLNMAEPELPRLLSPVVM